jgi:pSer/pThr/pTyr-binding forkhead associated (FHA) protein
MERGAERRAEIETREDATAASALADGERVVIKGGELTIGRALKNGLVIATERASRRHAHIYSEDRGWWIADLGSRHGTHSISYAIFSQWGLASVGDVVGMDDRIAANPAFSQANPYGEAFFDVAFGTGLLIQAGFAALLLVGVVLPLRARTSR